MTLSNQNWQSKGMMALWKRPETKPVIRYFHAFVGVDVTFGFRGGEESGVW